MPSSQITPGITFTGLLQYNHPQAVAWVTGNADNPQLSGLVKFYQTPYKGVLVEAEIFGLPDGKEPTANNFADNFVDNFYAMHIHQFGDCSNSFSKTGDHYNPKEKPHPLHAGDLLPLLSNQGYAWSAFYDKRFTINEIIGKSVIIHSGPDDFTTQPSGNSGIKIGCGEIRRIL